MAAEQTQRSEAGRFALALERAKVIAAEVDVELRYRWIANPHPEFDPASVLGKRDDECARDEGIRHLMALKRRVLESAVPEAREITFFRSNGVHVYDVWAEPILSDTGDVTGVRTAAVDVTARANAERQLQRQLEERAQFLNALAHEIRNSSHTATLSIRLAEMHPQSRGASLELSANCGSWKDLPTICSMPRVCRTLNSNSKRPRLTSNN